MPVRTQQIYPRSVSYAVGSNPSTGPFNIPFPFQDQGEIEVRVDGVVEPNVVITQASPYGISGNSVTLASAVANATVLILSVTEEIRLTGDNFGGPEASEEFDHLYAILQELRDRLIRLDIDLEHWDADARRLRNLADPTDAQDAATKAWVEAAPGQNIGEAVAAKDAAEAALASIQAITGEILRDAGAWATATDYEAGDVVTYTGSSYIAEVDHTSTGSFSLDLAGGNWRLLAAQGPAGAGSGDVLAANNGTEFTADTFASNLSLMRGYTTQYAGDLNTLASTALRRLGAATNGWTGLAAGDHVLHLQHDANTAMQIGYSNAGDIFYRKKTGGAWGLWFEVATQTDLAGIDAGLGEGQTWQAFDNTSRAGNTSYQNTTGRAIFVCMASNTGAGQMQVSDTGAFAGEQVQVGETDATTGRENASFIVPNGHYYRWTSGGSHQFWAELR